MSHNNIGNRIRRARKAAQLSHSRLCQTTGICSARLAQLENGHRFPTPEEWEKLSEQVPVGGCPPRHKLPAPQLRWDADRPKATSPERVFAVRFAAARASFPGDAELLDNHLRTREDARLCYEFLESAALDSGDEAFFYLKLLAAGATPCAYAPLRAGYRTLPVVDPATKNVIGDIRRPCLELDDDRQSILVFPQVSLLATLNVYRLDALVCARCPQQRLWINLEIDGPGHDHAPDRRRERRLNLPVIRLNRTELSAPELVPNLQHAIREIREQRRVS